MKKNGFQKYIILRTSTTVFLPFLFLIFVLFAIPVCKAAMISDWVVAFVDDVAITHSDLQDQYRETLKAVPNVTKEEVLNTMINRVLILREGKKYRIEEPSSEEIIKEYIDLKVRAFIRVSETDIEQFYKENSVRFSDKEYEEVRDDIEQFLIEQELNVRLKDTLQQLRKTAYIKILSLKGL